MGEWHTTSEDGLPPADGWYWVRIPESFAPTIVQVFRHNGEDMVYWNDKLRPVSRIAMWAGPIPAPVR